MWLPKFIRTYLQKKRSEERAAKIIRDVIENFEEMRLREETYWRVKREHQKRDEEARRPNMHLNPPCSAPCCRIEGEADIPEIDKEIRKDKDKEIRKDKAKKIRNRGKKK